MTNDTPKPMQGMPIVVHAQYLKDCSFENPGAPLSLRTKATAPDMNVNVNLEVKNIPDEKIDALFEVVIQFRVRAMRDDQPLFLADIDYGITVSITGVAEENRHAVLLIEVPKLAFPFARQILADLTAQGGFPPLYLTPIDFAALYIDKFSKKPA